MSRREAQLRTEVDAKVKALTSEVHEMQMRNERLVAEKEETAEQNEKLDGRFKQAEASYKQAAADDRAAAAEVHQVLERKLQERNAALERALEKAAASAQAEVAALEERQKPMYTRVRELEARTSVVADEKRKQSGVTTKLEKRLSELEGLYARAEEELSHSRKAIIQHEKREKELVVRSRIRRHWRASGAELEQSVELIESLEHRLDQANAEKDDLVRRLGMENAHDLSEMQRSVARVKAERDELMWRKDGLWAAAEGLLKI